MPGKSRTPVEPDVTQEVNRMQVETLDEPFSAEPTAAPFGTAPDDGVREVFVLSFGGPMFQDFGPHPVEAASEETIVSGVTADEEEGDDELDGADPKDSSAQVPAGSSESPEQTVVTPTPEDEPPAF